MKIPSVTSTASSNLRSSTWSKRSTAWIREGGSIFRVSTAWSRVRHIISFKGKDGMLRACPLVSVLRNGASILSDSHGSADTYAMSIPVDEIDLFLSHNWVVDRRQKFLVLSYFFNLPAAAATSLAVQILCIALSIAGVLPTLNVAWSPHPRGVACKALGTPVFLFVLYFGGELRRCLGLRGLNVFLDKTCIHQTDVECQKEGIRGLGASIRHSKSMLVIYTDVYLTKLWTVYEFACFLSLHPVSDMKLIPTVLSKTVFIALTILSVGLPLVAVLEYYTGQYETLAVTVCVLAIILCFTFRQEARAREAMHQRFAHFSAAECSCANEEDRPLVNHNISELMRAARKVKPSASDEEALSAFSTLARSKLPELVETAMGKAGHRYRDLATLSFTTLGSYWLDKLVAVGFCQTWPELLCDALSSVTLLFALTPLCLASMGALMRRCTDVCSPLEPVLVISAALCTTMLGALAWHASFLLWRESSFARDGRMDWLACANLAGMACTVCAALAVFASPPDFCTRLPGMKALPRTSVGWLELDQQHVEPAVEGEGTTETLEAVSCASLESPMAFAETTEDESASESATDADAVGESPRAAPPEYPVPNPDPNIISM